LSAAPYGGGGDRDLGSRACGGDKLKLSDGVVVVAATLSEVAADCGSRPSNVGMDTDADEGEGEGSSPSDADMVAVCVLEPTSLSAAESCSIVVVSDAAEP